MLKRILLALLLTVLFIPGDVLPATKADVVDAIVEGTNVSRTEAAKIVDSFLETIKNTLAEGRNIELRGFGTFKTKPRKARKARNPRTGEVVLLPARIIPVFKPSNESKNLVANALKAEQVQEADTAQ